MCGFIGKVSLNEFDYDALDLPNNLIVCRGPDSKKTFKGNISNNFPINNSLFCSLIFNRLSIIDLNENADQPMFSEKFQTSVMFNGEIYNHAKLRLDLEKQGLEFNTSHSDTEVVLLGLSFFGIDYVKNLIGQFSIVFIDYKTKTVSLIRDRLGQKPLFFKKTADFLTFSSNLKSLVVLDENYILDEESLVEFIDLGVVSSPKTIFKDIYKIKPAEIVNFKFSEKNITKETINYWNLNSLIGEKKFDENKFFELFKNAVSLRNISDVPIAHFLSGGIDSTSIVKMQKGINITPNTFSIGYENDKYDESRWFNEAVKAYKTNHVTQNISGNFTIENIEESINAIDEPYSDPSIVPAYLISKKMAKLYKVAISGDGGDELLGGYVRTLDSLRKKNIFSNIFSKLFILYPPWLGSGNKILSKSNNLQIAYESYFSDKKLLKLLKIKNKKNFLEKYFDNDLPKYKMFQLFEYKFYLSEMMMFKVDRTSMASSLEVRSPFVDHILIEYVLGSNSHYLDKQNSKKLLKEFLKEDFDAEFLDRKKMGFVFNIKKWIYGNTDYIKNFLNSGILKDYFPNSKVGKLFIFKTRVNALRIWKLYLIEKYIVDIENLIND